MSVNYQEQMANVVIIKINLHSGANSIALYYAPDPTRFEVPPKPIEGPYFPGGKTLVGEYPPLTEGGYGGIVNSWANAVLSIMGLVTGHRFNLVPTHIKDAYVFERVDYIEYINKFTANMRK